MFLRRSQMETALILKIFGLGCVGIVGTIILNKFGKQDIAFVMDLVITVIVIVVVFKKVEAALNSIATMFGVM
jgi:hypothetical protein